MIAPAVILAFLTRYWRHGLIASLIVAAAGAGVLAARWYFQRDRPELLRDLANARAAADSLRLVAVSSDSTIKVYAKASFVARDENELLGRELAEERRAREKARLELRSVTELAVSYRNRLVGAGTVTAAGDDTTRIRFSLRDGALAGEGIIRFPGTVAPDPEPEASVELDVALAQLRLRVSTLLDPKTCAPTTTVTSLDKHVRTTQVEAIYDQRMTCIKEKHHGFPWPLVAAGLGGLALLLATH